MTDTDKTRAAEARAKALGGRDERFISALEIERQGYVIRGMDDRVAQVDAQIALYGGEKPAAKSRRKAPAKPDDTGAPVDETKLADGQGDAKPDEAVPPADEA